MKKASTTLINLETFRETYDLYYEALCKFLFLYTKDVQIVEDIVQEIFLSLWENKNTIEINYIKTYLFQSAKNKMLNYLRDEKNRSVLLERWFDEQMREKSLDTNSFEVEKLLAIVENAIESLPQKCKEIFILNKIENLSYKKVAELKGLSIKTVENQMGIALKKIREFLSDKTFLILITQIVLFF